MKKDILNCRRAPTVTRVRMVYPEKLSVVNQLESQAILREQIYKNNETERL